MFKNLFNKPLEAAKDKVNDFVNLKVEEVKLTAIEKIAPIAATMLIGFIILFTSLVVFIFMGFALAEWLTELYKSATYGYLTTAGIFLLFLVIILLAFKSLSKKIADKIAGILYDIFSK